jgi:hypothetical protein
VTLGLQHLECAALIVLHAQHPLTTLLYTTLLRKHAIISLCTQIEELIDRQVGPDVRSRGRAFSRSGASDISGVSTMYADVATALAFTWATDEQPQVRLQNYLYCMKVVLTTY